MSEVDAQDATPSYTSLISRLRIGETFARASRIELFDADSRVVTTTMDRLRQAMSPVVFRAAARTGAKYKVESGIYLTQSHDVMLVVAVTCVYHPEAGL